MSGLVKGVKKVFKKAAGFVKKYWKPIVAAVAIYFTAGVALSYFGSTANFASNLWGFGTNGIFSKAAVWMGFNGTAGSGLFATAVQAGKIAPIAATTANTTGVLAAGANPTPEIASNFVTGQAIESPTLAAIAEADQAGKAAAGSLLTQTGQTVAGAGQGATTSDALIKAIEAQSKLGWAKLAIDTVSGLTAPNPYEEQRKTIAFQNQSSFGVGRDGNQAFGWGSSDSAQGWANMNKQPGALGSSGQSQFRNAQFVPTQHEQANQYGSMGQPQFIPRTG